MLMGILDLTGMLANPKIEFWVGLNVKDSFSKIVSYFQERGKIFLVKSVKPIYYSKTISWHKTYYMEFLKQFREGATFALIYYGNDPDDSLIGVENMLDNVNEIVSNPGINSLFGAFTGKPAIVVSAGPSLNKNKHLLKELQDKAFIICPDASLKILLELGIKPHLITALERVVETVELADIYTEEETKDVYYAACPVVPKEAYEVYKGPRLIVYRQYGHFSWLGVDKGMLNIKQSSGNMAFKIAQAVGCDPIILIGQDLAYSREGISHASGTHFGENQFVVNEDSFEVEGNDGQPILTHRDWNEFRKSYEVDVAEYEGTCINATEGGALIHGTEIMTFQEAIDKYVQEQFAPLEIIKEKLKAFTSENAKKDEKAIRERMIGAINDIESMIEKCEKGIELYNEHQEFMESYLIGENKDGNGNIDDIKKIVDNILIPKKEVFEHQHTMQYLLMHIIQSFNIKFEVDLNSVGGKYDHESMVLAEIGLSHFKWYSTILSLIQIIKTSLEDSLERLEKNGVDEIIETDTE